MTIFPNTASGLVARAEAKKATTRKSGETATYMPSILLTVFGGIFATTLAIYSSDDVVKIVGAIAAAAVAFVGAIGLWGVRILKAMEEKQVAIIQAMEKKHAETIVAMKQKMAEAIVESPLATSPEEKALERKATATVTATEVIKQVSALPPQQLQQQSDRQQREAKTEPPQPR